MIIEHIKYNKKSANITIDGECYERVSLTTLMQYGFKAGLNIDMPTLSSFLQDSSTQNAKDYLMNLLAKGARTEKMCYTKLKEKGYPTASINEAIKLAKSYNYICDNSYAKNYISSFSHVKGGYRLKRELYEKGVAEDIVENALADSEIDEYQSAAYVAEKYMRNRKIDEKTKERLFRHLASRGFNYDAIRNAVAKVNISLDDDSY